MTQPEWTRSYSCHSLNLLAVVCRVNYENKCYKASVCGEGKTLKLKTEFDDLDNAKRACLVVARKLLGDSLALFTYDL